MVPYKLCIQNIKYFIFKFVKIKAVTLSTHCSLYRQQICAIFYIKHIKCFWLVPCVRKENIIIMLILLPKNTESMKIKICKLKQKKPVMKKF